MHSLPSHLLYSPLFIALTALFACQAHATEQTLPTVTVTDTTTSNSGRADLEQQSIKNPYRVESSAQFGNDVLTREDIKVLAPKDVFDLLDKATGLNVTYQGRRSPFFVDERGGGSMTYILDGAILPTSSNRILQNIPMAAIEEVQIVRGATALTLGPLVPIGSSASGSGINTGFVIIRTRRPKGLEAETSAYVEQAESQPLANGQSLFAGTMLGQPNSANGYIGTLFSRSDTPSKDDWFDGRKAKSGMFTSGFNVGKFSLNTMGYRDTGRLEMQRGVTVTGALDNSKWYYDPIETTILSSDARMDWTENQVTLFSVFDTRYKQHEINESFANTTSTTRDFEEKTNGYSLSHNAQFGDTLIQFGHQLANSKGFGANTNNPYNNWLTSVKGWSAAVEQKLFSALTLNAGYRQDKKHIDYSATSQTALAANAGKDMSPATAYALGARWLVIPDVALDARYFDGNEGTSGDFDIKTKDSSPLHAARQHRREFAVEYNAFPMLRPMLTWFDVSIDNQKSATTDTYTVSGETYYYYTESDSRRQGAELMLKGVLPTATHYSFAWTHLTKNQSSSSGNAIGSSIPKNIYTASVSQEWGPYRVNASIKRVDPYNSSTSAMGTAYNVHLGDYTRLDANVSRDFNIAGHTLNLKLYGRNLSDVNYATRYTTGYYYDRGRTVGIETTAKF